MFWVGLIVGGTLAISILGAVGHYVWVEFWREFFGW